MRAMHSPLGMTLVVVGAVLLFLLAAAATASLIGLTLFLVRRSRTPGPPPTG